MRDVGGHATAFGTRVRRGRLFRWSACAETDDGDPRKLGLGSVFDTAVAPRDLRSRRGWVTRAFYEIPLVEPAESLGSEFEILLESSDSVAELLAILTDPNAYPTAIGSSSGNDHSDSLLTLLLAWLGVPDHEIRASIGPSSESRLCDDPLLRTVRHRFGSVDGYAQFLGLDRALGYIRDALLVDGDNRTASSRQVPHGFTLW